MYSCPFYNVTGFLVNRRQFQFHWLFVRSFIMTIPQIGPVSPGHIPLSLLMLHTYPDILYGTLYYLRGDMRLDGL